MDYSDDIFHDIFTTVDTIACVGASANVARPSHYVSEFLRGRGYRVIGVNPGQAGKVLFGETAVATLADIKVPVQMIDVFRRSSDVLPVVEAAIRDLPDLRVIWMQIGVENEQAATLARDHGLIVIENRCPKVEFPRLYGAKTRDQI